MLLTMPLANAHLEQARDNYQLYRQLRVEGKHLDWALTLLFYAALQAVQAYLVETAVTGFEIPRGHDQRREAVRLRLWSIWVPYRSLDNASRVARYHQDTPDPTEAQLEYHYTADFQVIIADIEARFGFPLQIESTSGS